MKDENDIIDIPTELEIEEPKQEVETLETPEVEELIMVEPKESLNEPIDNIPEQVSESLVIETPEQNSNLDKTQILEPVVEEIQVPQVVEEVSISNNIPEVFPTLNEVSQNVNSSNNVEIQTPMIPDVPSSQPIITTNEMNNNELNAISLNNVEEPQKMESLDGNPDTLDIKVRGIDDKKPKKKVNIKIIIMILVAVIVLAISGVLYYNYLVDKKEKNVQKEPNLQIAELKTSYSFEEAYKKVSANFDVKSESQNLKYELKEGKLEIVKKEQSITASVKDVNIVSISILKELDTKDIVGLKDDKNNFYFVEINHNIDKETELNYQNNKLLTIPNDGSIQNIAIADYLNNKGYFYIAEKGEDNFFIGEKDGNITTISEIYLNVYNGTNIDFADLNINKDARKKMNFDGIGIFYDGTLFMYQGKVENIKEKEIKDGGNSLDCSHIYLSYREDLKYFDLYIITEENQLYQINLLEQEFNETKVNLIKKENLVKEHSMIENDGVYYLEITLDNDEKISVK